MKKNKLISLFRNNKDVPIEGIKYSDLLNDFIEPFEKDFPSDYSIEDVFDFAINAWNFATLGKALPPEDFQDTPPLSKSSAKENAIHQKMIALKATKFDDYDRYILDYTLEAENIGELKLTVITGDAEAFFESIEDDFAENYINRSAIVLKPQQPFFDWINNLYPDDKVTEAEEANIYLIDDMDDLEKWLKKKFDKLFTMELDEWHTNKKEWPQKRNYKMFKQWFQVDKSTMIYDLERSPIIKEE